MQRFPRLLAILVLVLLVFPAQAQDGATPGAPGIGDDYFPRHGNGGYDVQHYAITLSADPGTGIIDAEVTVEAVATQPLSRFNFDFTRYTVEAVTVDGAPAAHVQTGGEFSITPGEPIASGAAFTVKIAYSGAPSGTGWFFHPGGVLVAGEPVSASGWFPVNEHPLDKATYRYTVTVPEPFVVAANGVLVNTVDQPDGRRTYVWEMDDPMASYLATVAIGDFTRYEYPPSASGVVVRDYIYTGAPQSTLDVFALAPEMIDVLEAAFGPYPFDVYGVVVHDLALQFALETQTLSVFGRTFVNERVALHELAHQWFGNSVSLARWQDIWLNEGFASYAEIIWLEHRGGAAARDAGVREFYANMARYTQFREPVIIGDPTPAALFSGPVYQRGALTLHALRLKLGDDAFFDLLRTYAATFHDSNATTADFIALAEDFAGDDLSGLFDAWLYEAALPDIPAMGLFYADFVE